MRKKGGRAGRAGEAGTSRKAGWTEREDTVTMTGTETPELPRDRPTDTDGTGLQTQRKEKETEITEQRDRGEMACGHVKMCTTANKDFFFFF